MSLIGRIKQEQDSRLLENSAANLAAERVRDRQLQQLESIIRDSLQKVADSLGEKLTVIDSGYYYQIGDVVLLVEQFQTTNGLPDPDDPKLVVTEYLVWLIGVDKRTNRLDKLRRGMLRFLNYDTLYDSITTAPTYLDLHADEVLMRKEQLGRFK